MAQKAAPVSRAPGLLCLRAREVAAHAPAPLIGPTRRLVTADALEILLQGEITGLGGLELARDLLADGAAELLHPHPGAAEPGSGKAHMGELAGGEIEPDEIRVGQIGAREIRAVELHAGQVGAAQA
ncbi:hypothetical protein AEGHOMDF_2471 [Methylobacterium soli]|nr:hypothetical protein AEGHOMDF_2471 [Methylobacterium soli]